MAQDDGLRERDMKKLKWRFSASLEDHQKIAVAGLESGVGVTHFCMLMSAYYRFHAGKRVCVVDLSGNADYSSMEQMYFGHKLAQEGGYFYNIHKLEFLVGDKGERLIQKALAGAYEVVIFDCGTKARMFEKELLMCDKKYLLADCAPWKQQALEQYLEAEQPKTGGQKQMFGYALGVEENAQVIGEKYKIDMVHIPYIENPFRMKKKQLEALVRIME